LGRARGDHTAMSDVDLAFEGDFSAMSFGAFASTTKEEARTLLSLDLVDMNRCSETLKATIYREGVILYEAKRAS
jgi:predicted nucleotidyltransferase